VTFDAFRCAIDDYRYLRERSYSARAALKLVGDRHELPAEQRNLLFRGVMPRAEAAGRRTRLVPDTAVRGRRLGIDWYNVLITVESYLKGATVFVADDGVVRDAAAVHGSYRVSRLTEQAIGALASAVQAAAPSAVDIFVDAPVAFSGEMAAILRARFSGGPFPVTVRVIDSPDHELKLFDGVVATSDSAVIDRAESVLDLARAALAAAHGFQPPTLGDLGRAP
jgi:hypothetical protein